MSEAENVALELTWLSPTSRSFAERLLQRLPALKDHLRMFKHPETDEFELSLKLDSPTGDLDRSLRLWVDDEISFGFGSWHTHEGVWLAQSELEATEGNLVDLVCAVLDDRFVITVDIGGDHHGECSVLDLRKSDAVVEELTNPHVPGRTGMEIKTWSGRGDRLVRLEDLPTDNEGTE